jgi:hypothetical protein
VRKESEAMYLNRIKGLLDEAYVEMLKGILEIGKSKRRPVEGSDVEGVVDFVNAGTDGKYSSEDVVKFSEQFLNVLTRDNESPIRVHYPFQFLICAGLDSYIEKTLTLLSRQSCASGIRISDNDFDLLEFMLYLKNLNSFSHWELNIPTIGKQISSDMESYRGLRSGKIVEVLCPGIKGKSYLRPVVKVEGSY